MQEYKIVVLGSMGAGKSTLVRTVAGKDVVDTDVANTDPGSDKAGTTVAMDYADIDLPNGDRMRLYGSPGQARFDFVWPILLQGAAGVVVLIDATGNDLPAEFERYLEALREFAPQVPTVAGLTKSDLRPDGSVDTFYESLQQTGRTMPIVPLDARDGDQILMLMDVLMSEIESADLANADA
ncbi:MAG: GTP-binding protein [Luteimonas sp.]